MSDPEKDDLKRAFDYAADTRKMEIGLFWQRSLFFWGFIAAAFVAYAAAKNATNRDDDLLLEIACFGTICSVAWTLANRGSKYWQTVWENRLEAIERDGLKIGLFEDPFKYKKVERHFWGIWSKKRHFSVSRLAIALSDCAVGVWILLVCKATPLQWPLFLKRPILIPIATAAYILMMLVGARSKSLPSTSKP